jgi:ribosomal subunit interface protein
MIKRFDVTFIHLPVDENVQKYVSKKLGRLDRYIPRTAQDSAHAEIILKNGKAKDGRDSTCEVALHLPHDNINVSETSINMYTAVDIVELKLKQQIKKYKDLHAGSLRRRLTARLAR